MKWKRLLVKLNNHCLNQMASPALWTINVVIFLQAPPDTSNEWHYDFLTETNQEKNSILFKDLDYGLSTRTQIATANYIITNLSEHQTIRIQEKNPWLEVSKVKQMPTNEHGRNKWKTDPNLRERKNSQETETKSSRLRIRKKKEHKSYLNRHV